MSSNSEVPHCGKSTSFSRNDQVLYSPQSVVKLMRGLLMCMMAQVSSLCSPENFLQLEPL